METERRTVDNREHFLIVDLAPSRLHSGCGRFRAKWTAEAASMPGSLLELAERLTDISRRLE